MIENATIIRITAPNAPTSGGEVGHTPAVGTLTEQRARQMATRSSIVAGGARRIRPYRDEYYTPPAIVRALGRFDLDPCAGPTRLARRCIRRPKDGLRSQWTGRIWMNAPYSNLPQWLDRFIEHGNGICLVNARPETRWFQRLLCNASACLWIAGRVQFGNPRGVCHPPVGSVLFAIGKANAAALRRAKIQGVVTLPLATGNRQLATKNP